MAKPQVKLGSAYCVLDRPVFEWCQTLLHPELTPWWSFLLADGGKCYNNLQHWWQYSNQYPVYSLYHKMNCLCDQWSDALDVLFPGLQTT